MEVAGAAAAATAALGAYFLLIRPWHSHWGATRKEAQEPLPGDEFVPHPTGGATHAITINAPVRDVWPWLAQMGQDKGGFYSYTWLENLAGCHMRNADAVMPQYQHIAVGDKVWLHPEAPPMTVEMVQPNHAIVLGSSTGEPGAWSFYLKRINENTTRLLVRCRWQTKPRLLNRLGALAVLEPAHFIMERKMLVGIKERAERLAQSRAAAVPENPAAGEPSPVPAPEPGIT